MTKEELLPLYSSEVIVFVGFGLKGKARGLIITGEGYLRKGDKVYIYGRDMRSGRLNRDAWHLVDAYDVHFSVHEIKRSKKGK